MRHILTLTASLLLLVSCYKNSKLVIEENSHWKHVEALDSIAKVNNNNRSVGSIGGIATKEYIIDYISKNNGKVVTQEFVNHENKNGTNILVEIPGKSDSIILLGGHYDSVLQGPGINDNATGVSILLDLYETLIRSNKKPEHNIHIAFWDAEETGIEGSKYYVNQLSDQQKQLLKSYINIDMVGTINPEILLLDGDGSSFIEFGAQLKENGLAEEDIQEIIEEFKNSSPKQVKEAEVLENEVRAYLDEQKIKFKDDYTLSLSTDVNPFIGITPTTGIVFINEQISNNENGDSIIHYAPCYHQACDNIENVDKNSVKIARNLTFHLINKLAFDNKLMN